MRTALSEKLKFLPGWATRLIDAWQIWNEQFSGMPAMILTGILGAAGTLWTWFGESWLPMAIVAGGGTMFLVYKILGPSASSSIVSAGETSGTPANLRGYIPTSKNISYARSSDKAVSPAQAIVDDFAIKHMRWMCESSIDPATRELQNLISYRADELQSSYPGGAQPVFETFKMLMPNITNEPRDLVHNFLVSGDQLDPQQAATMLKTYLKSYVQLTNLMMNCYAHDRRALVGALRYKAWHGEHVKLRKIIKDLAFDSKLEVISKQLGCIDLGCY